MALSASIYKVELNISDMDRHYYQSHNLTVARHPSETETRMMIRLLAFALNAGEYLSFTKGLSSDEEPDIWEKNLSGEIEHWIEIGQPSEERIRKAASRSLKQTVYSYGKQAADHWRAKVAPQCVRFENLQLFYFPVTMLEGIERYAEKKMQLHISIQDGELFLNNDALSSSFTLEQWQ